MLNLILGLVLFLQKTRYGMIIRAGVENREMVEALGYRIRRLFLGVFMTGSALAGLGGIMWTLYREQVHASVGDELTVLIFIVVIIGGLGSIEGAAIGALIVGLARSFAVHVMPQAELFSIYIVMALVLMVRPEGLFQRIQARKI
jgi:branched-chain amino acid transport system permease protein